VRHGEGREVADNASIPAERDVSTAPPMTRVVAGAARGRRLAVPPGQGTRPTSDRAREGLFSTLGSLLGAWAGRRVLDLYAGSGAVGLEALSRGADHVLLVEADPRAAATVVANIETLGLPGAVLLRGRVERLVGDGLPGPAYDVVFADPPYDLGDDALGSVLTDLHPALVDGAVVAVERATRGSAWSWPDGFEALRSRRYGEATLWYGRATPGRPAPSGVEESPA
jgi:16S rRNA (guanine966-N2)-methyltransferase